MRTLSTVAVAALATAGIAAAAGDARQCHPDPAGTRSATLTGVVTAYRFAGRGTIVASVQTERCAGVARWNYTAKAHEIASVSCEGSNPAGSAAPAQQLVAAQGNRLVRVVLAPDGVDSPDRLDVIERATGRRIASWPLIERPSRVVLYRGIAILSGADRRALYALRISDGRIAMLGISRGGDQPIIGPEGVVYQDDQYLKLHRLAPNRVTMKLVPLAAVAHELSLADQQITTRRITAIAMDGRRVAFAVHDPNGRCDVVRFWIPAWSFVAPVTQKSGPTCLPTHATGGVTNVAIAGDRLIWTTHYGNTTRVLAASAIACEEWVVARPAPGGAPVAGLSGDGSVLAYALKGAGTAARPGTVGVVPGGWRGEVVSQSAAQVAAISVDSNQIATLYRDGTVTVMSAAGEFVSRFAAGPARAIALRRDTVAVLRHGQLAVYSAETGLLTHSWPVPLNARSVDLHYGIAVIAAGGEVFALNVTTGRTARLLHVHGRVAAQIESPGVVVQFNVGERGYLRFIPMSTVEARTR